MSEEVVQENVQPSASTAPAAETAEDVIEYTYKKGDTFGQVVTDLGLKSDAGLWGTNGDVAYYTQQLIDQGALDKNGNIPIGTTIKLKKRKAQPMEWGIDPNTGQKRQVAGPQMI